MSVCLANPSANTTGENCITEHIEEAVYYIHGHIFLPSLSLSLSCVLFSYFQSFEVWCFCQSIIREFIFFIGASVP